LSFNIPLSVVLQNSEVRVHVLSQNKYN